MELLLRWLSENRVTHEELAKRLEVHASNISLYLNRHTNPSLAVFKRLVDVTGLPCGKLLNMFVDSPLRKKGAR